MDLQSMLAVGLTSVCQYVNFKSHSGKIEIETLEQLSTFL